MAELIIREAIRRGLHEALATDDRVFLMGEDIGAYPGELCGHARLLRGVRPGTHPRLSHSRVGDNRLSDRRGDGGNASHRRDDDDQLHAPGHRSGGKPRGQDELYVERSDQGAARDSSRYGRGRTPRGDALAELRGLVRFGAGVEGVRSLRPVRRAGTAPHGNSGPESGYLRRAWLAVRQEG